LSVEEENLAAIPFAVLERRVGKGVSKLEISGTKVLPNGEEVRVNWQVQGNSELGLPTEQDMDVFIALGVLTFRNNFSKTVSFTGREIARILNISSVHGKFYQRLKVAMDRFIPLRFRAISESDHVEDVKWLNVFQEASFSLDRDTGRCVGSITWTDKLIQSMDSGFFRVLDAGRYMELDGITAKHMYRFLTVAFEKNDLILIDARKLCAEHLGIQNLPKYFSRLMQTLEPAFEQLIKIEVLGSFYIVCAEDWKLGLRRHASYVPERKSLLSNKSGAASELTEEWCRKALENAGFTRSTTEAYCANSTAPLAKYTLNRAARLTEAMKDSGVLAHVALSAARRALDAGLDSEECCESLDWIEIAIDTCTQKQRSGQVLRNAAGLLVKIALDTEARERLVSEEQVHSSKRRFRQREQIMLRELEQAEERVLIAEYENFRREFAESYFTDLPEANRQAMRKEKFEQLRDQGRLARLAPDTRATEIDDMILIDLAVKWAPVFEKWRLRRAVRQATLPFQAACDPFIQAS
jgi:hypothetical protein